MTDGMRLVLALLLAGATACQSVPAGETTAGKSFNLYLVRHAEKQADPDDPGLTVEGRQRADFFARWLADRNIGSIWSSDYRRTRDTARPLADSLRLEVEIYDPRQQQVLLGRLLDNGVSALVVGHSNTIPELASLLCDCEIAAMDHNDYDRAFVVRVSGSGVLVDETDLALLRTGYR